MNRYLVVQEPTCTWAVFDACEDQPVILEGRMAVGLDKSEAIDLAVRANALIGARVTSLIRARAA